MTEEPKEASAGEEIHEDLDAGEEADKVVGGLRRRIIGDPDEGGEFA